MTIRTAVVTGTRAEYGLLWPLLDALRASPDFALQLLVTGMHLAPEFGMTVREIEADGFPIDARVEMLLSSDSAVGIAKSVGLGVQGIADALASLAPDWVLLVGDRFEAFAAAQAAYLLRIPIAHVAGGDVTEGALDEGLRHAITKLAALHLTTNASSARRVRQMGEEPWRVHDVGHLGVDAIRRTALRSREEIAATIGMSLTGRNLLVTFHPATREVSPPGLQADELLAALDGLGPEFGVVFTMPNADEGGRDLGQRIRAFVARRPRAVAVASLGRERYLSLLALVDAVVGNSSSGVYEAPSFRKPTVNIGTRQTGRLMAASVITCAPERRAIGDAIRRALVLDCAGVINPYGGGDAAERILNALLRAPTRELALAKPFVDGPTT